MSLHVRQLSAGYAGANVIHDVDLDVEKGELVALLGANGAGKTTLMNALSGQLRAQAGDVRFEGTGLRGLRPHRYARAGVRWVGDPRPIYAEMSVNDNLVVGGFTTGRDLKERLEEIYERFPELASRRGEKAGSLSGGQSQMLALAQALMSHPRLLLMDEPSVGLSIAVLSRLGEIARSLASEGVSVLWSEQFPDIVLKYCDSAIVMAGGYCQEKKPTKDFDVNSLEAAYFGAAQSS